MIGQDKLIRLFICLCLSFGLSLSKADGQILGDTSTIALIKKEVDYIYNLQFREAEEVLEKICSRHPGHPVNYLLEGMNVYWKNYPLIASSSARPLFENTMRKCIEKCDTVLPGYESELLLANLGARGMLLTFYADNHLSMEVFPLAIGTYKYLRQSFNHTRYFSDFYFFTGLYNYYRQVYPEFYPIYKPLAVLFPKGDKLKGLSELETASETSIFLRAESASFLSWMYTGFENEYNKASYYSSSLCQLYPSNVNYQALHIKNLLLEKKYDEAEILLDAYRKHTVNSYFNAQLDILNGILQENKYQDQEQAQIFYNEGLKRIAPFGDYGSEYSAYAYFGLSRISERRGDKSSKRTYHRKAMDLAAFKKITFSNDPSP